MTHIKQKKRKKNNFKKLKPLLIISFIALFLLIFYFSFLNNKLLIFPLLHRYQSSPSKYVKMKKDILTTTLPLPEVIEHGPRNKKEIALTFDADMTYSMYKLLKNGSVKSWYNKPVITYLNQEDIKATIFLTGLWAKAYPKEARDIAQNPLFEIGNHSFSHPAFTANCFGLPLVSDGKEEDEVSSAQKIIIQITKVVPQIFRFPGGCNDKVNLETVSRLGLTIVHWDVVARDGFNYDTQSIVNNVEKNVQNGSIIVMHLNDGTLAPKTYYALLKIIPDLKKQGFNFVKISDLVKEN